jgi:hypothetical protein
MAFDIAGRDMPRIGHAANVLLFRSDARRWTVSGFASPFRTVDFDELGNADFQYSDEPITKYGAGVV